MSNLVPKEIGADLLAMYVLEGPALLFTSLMYSETGDFCAATVNIIFLLQFRILVGTP